MFFIGPCETQSRFLAHIKEEHLESGETNEHFLERAYNHWLEYYSKRFERYEDHLKLNLDQRYEFERIVKQLVGLLKSAGISQSGGHGGDLEYDVECINLKFAFNGSDELRDVIIARRESCYSSIEFEMTQDEIEMCATRAAQRDLEHELWSQRTRKEQEAKEKAEREAYDKAYAKAELEFMENWRKWKQENPDEPAWKCPYTSGVWSSPERYFREQEMKKLAGRQVGKTEVMTSDALNSQGPAADSKDDYNPYAEPEKFAKGLVEDMTKHENCCESAFMKFYNSLATDAQNAIDTYIDTCRDFTEAMNEGLTGMGLYSFNERRAEAHESMLETFGLEDDHAARVATKDFDFVDTYNVVKNKYIHRPYEDAENYLAYVLVKCRQHMLQRQSKHIGSPAEIAKRIMEP